VVTDLPDTGSDLTPFALIGMALLLTGGLAVNKARGMRE
jgi:LPXTG-motif cell wall-anchored protein